MGIFNFTFKIEELGIEVTKVASLMGYTGDVPDETRGQIKNELANISHVDGIEGGFVIHDVQLNKEHCSLCVNDQEFKVGADLIKHYENAQQVALFVCTAGASISSRSKELMNQGHLIEGYILDIIGSVVVEHAMDKIHVQLKHEMTKKGLKCTNRYSPGYCEWDVSEQNRLFSFLPKEFCGVSLSESCLMQPIKSVSGIIGIGQDVEERKYTCAACSSVNCLYRRKK